MAQVLIRNLDEDVVARLKRNAETAGLSLEAYLREALVNAARPSKEDILARIDALRAKSRPSRPGEPTAAEIVREMRDERTAHLAHLLGLDK